MSLIPTPDPWPLAPDPWLLAGWLGIVTGPRLREPLEWLGCWLWACAVVFVWVLPAALLSALGERWRGR